MNANFMERLAELPANLSNHLMLTVIALGVGVLLGVPLAVALARWAKLRYPLLTAAGIIQTIPSLALLALMVPLLAMLKPALDPVHEAVTNEPFQAFGFYPAAIALTLYSFLPILRNTVTGIVGVDPAMTEAARGLGMTERQVLLKVELPLAAPVIIAGIRTATVWVVGIATLATPVGQRCLGNYIFTGLQTRNWLMVMFGVVAAAGLAVLLDLLIAGLQKSAAERRRAIGYFSGALLLVVIFGGLVSPTIVRATRSTQRTAAAADEQPAAAAVTEDMASLDDQPVRIGSKTFTEQYILSALIEKQLADNGLPATTTGSLGSTVVFDALVNGSIDVYVDYSGTIWANYMNREKTAAPWRVLAQVTGWLADEHKVRCLGSMGFENAYALVMRRGQAEELGIETIADLAEHSGEMKIGGDYEFFGRPEWEQMRDIYGLGFAEQTSFDSTLMYEAVAGGQVDVISAFSSDGRIAAYDLVVLSDPRNVIPPYDAVVLVGSRVADDDRVIDALQPLIGTIDVETMQKANLKVDREEDKQTPKQAARWLDDHITP